MTNDKEYMRQYQKNRREKIKAGEWMPVNYTNDKHSQKSYKSEEWCKSWYLEALKKKILFFMVYILKKKRKKNVYFNLLI